MLIYISFAKYSVCCHPDELAKADKSYTLFLGRISAYKEILRERIIGDFLRKTIFYNFAGYLNKR